MCGMNLSPSISNYLFIIKKELANQNHNVMSLFKENILVELPTSKSRVILSQIIFKRLKNVNKNSLKNKFHFL